MARTVAAPRRALPPPKEPAPPAIPGEVDFARGSDAPTRHRAAGLAGPGSPVLMKGIRVDAIDVIENQRDRGVPRPVLRRHLAVAARGPPGHGPVRTESAAAASGILRPGHRRVRRTALGHPGGFRRRRAPAPVEDGLALLSPRL